MPIKRGANTFAHDRLLTEVELELMNIIWSLNKVTIKDIVSNLPKERPLAYTTVATVVKVLEQKGFLGCQKTLMPMFFSQLLPRLSMKVHVLSIW